MKTDLSDIPIGMSELKGSTLLKSTDSSLFAFWFIFLVANGI